LELTGNMVRITSIVMMSLLLSACSRLENTQDLQIYVDDVKSRPGAEVEPVPVFTPYEAFIYGAASFRSPFERPLIALLADGSVPSEDVEPDLDRLKEALEEHAFSELAMVGSMGQDGEYYALISDGVGAIHRVGVGNYLGRNFGRITGISTGQVNLIEIVPSGSGGWIERPQTLSLRR